MKTLFINCCVRKDSRTLTLARHYLNGISGEIIELTLENEHISYLDGESLKKRDKILQRGDMNAPELRYAKQFAEAEHIVIAAPYWDLSFPALLKCYLEAVTVLGVTFCYSKGVPKGLCKADKLVYITTAGGEIFTDFGYSYVQALAQNFYGIKNTVCFKAENLDVDGVNVSDILTKTMKEIDIYKSK